MPFQHAFSRLRPVTPASSSPPAEVDAEHNPQPHSQAPSQISALEEQAITHATQMAVALASPAERPQSPVDPDRKPQKKALLIGICRVADPPECQKERTGPHKDVETTRKLLIEKYGYHPGDIVSLVDTESQEEGLLPTKDNIMKQIKLLVRWAKAGDRFYFHFSGHSGQVPTTDIREYDLMDEFLWTSDGKTIMDDVLREELVDKVPKNASLTVVFDSCTSGTLLGATLFAFDWGPNTHFLSVDLDHWRCNQIYVPWVNKGARKTDSLWNITRRRLAAFRLHFSRIPGSRSGSNESTMATRREEVFDENNIQENGRAAGPSSPGSNQKAAAQSSLHGLKRYRSPESIHCNGYCHGRRVPWISNNVVCLSSAADGQKTYEDGNGTSMTVALIDLLEREPHPTLESVLTLVSFDLHQKYVTLHAASRAYRKEVREFNATRLARGKSPRMGKEVEMNNFQTPQLSSHQPLDMNLLWNP
ncbi:unnamed protein product [Cyclocybe aegerita]|uniref:Peptidase C14 caspase domain-containing protein n=1 Tax=Cyclocybe aegerita TaxID=1973307 RepID=A0A8S0XNN8_CYCAE|nr:unnamed protein product [Cyclocybe aegerita]